MKARKKEGGERSGGGRNKWIFLPASADGEGTFPPPPPPLHQVLLKINDARMRKEGICNLPVGAQSVHTTCGRRDGYLSVRNNQRRNEEMKRPPTPSGGGLSWSLDLAEGAPDVGMSQFSPLA